MNTYNDLAYIYLTFGMSDCNCDFRIGKHCQQWLLLFEVGFYNYHPPPMRLCGISLTLEKIEKRVEELEI